MYEYLRVFFNGASLNEMFIHIHIGAAAWQLWSYIRKLQSVNVDEAGLYSVHID